MSQPAQSSPAPGQPSEQGGPPGLPQSGGPQAHIAPPPGAPQGPGGPLLPQPSGYGQGPPPLLPPGGFVLPGGAPQPTPAHGGSTVQDTTGSFEGMHFRIDHRDSNSILTINLQQGYEIKAKPGTMVVQSPTVAIRGNFKFSFKKMVSGGDMSESVFTGPGEVMLAPEIWGDIIPIPVSPNQPWNIGKDAFLACTKDIVKSVKSQGFGKGIFSGEGFFIAKVEGNGVLFVQSLGAIIQRHLAQGEQLIVDNGHLVAWSATYTMERIGATGGFMSASHTDEGFVCRFTGPGTIYIQTRNPSSLGNWVASQSY